METSLNFSESNRAAAPPNPDPAAQPTPPNPEPAAQPSPLQVLTETITKSVLNAVNDKLVNNRSELMDNVKSLLAETAPDITERATKRMKKENPDISNPGCLDQFQHNSDVLRTIEKAARAILKGDGDAGLKSLSEGKKLINHRQKLVRLADREEKGWRFVKEYEKDKLADDSDDERAIARARRAANAKSPRGSSRRPPYRQQNRNFQNRNFQTYRNQSSSSYQPRDQQPSSSSYQYGNNYQQQNRNSQQFHAPRSDFRRNRYDRECFLCNQRGHLSYDCPRR